MATAVEISGHQAKRDGGETGPAADRKAPDRQQRGHRGEPDEEGHGVSNRDPVGEVERLDIGREHLKPRPVIPKRKFHGLEVGAVHKTAGVPGERLGTVVVGIELIDGKSVVGGRRKPHHQHGAQQGRRGHVLGIDCTARLHPPLEPAGRCRHVGSSMTLKPTNGADQRARRRGLAGERQEAAALRDFDSTYVGFD
jgi:hypothetical protein